MAILARLDAARRELLDLGTRNPLISHRPAKVRGFLLRGPAAPVWQALAEDDDALPVVATGWTGTGRHLAAAHPEEELPKRLHATARDARLAIEERGAHLLHLAIGALVWRDAEGGERCAPLALLPVALTRSGGRWRLAAAGEAVENLCLTEFLRRDGIALPAFPDSYAPDAWAALVAPAVAERGWRVDADRLAVDCFAFETFLMFRDLDPAAWPAGSLERHPLLDHLFGRGFPAEPPLLPAAVAAARAPGACAEVVEADGSQAAVLAEVVQGRTLVVQGRTLVVQGPPGTGKSQTITNCIAEAVAAGRTVLFVAEKQAALGVVHRRLDKLGLGDACLLVASDQVTRRAIAGELRRVLDAPAPPAPGPDPVPDLLAVARELAATALAEGDPVGGLTPAQAVDVLAELAATAGAPDPTTPDLDGAALAQLPAEAWPRVLAAAAALAAACARARGAETFAPARRSPVTPADERRLPPAVQAAIDALEAFRPAVTDAAVDLGVPSPADPVAAVALARFAGAAATAPAAAWWAPAWTDLPAMAAAVDAWSGCEAARTACPVTMHPGAERVGVDELTALRADILAHGGGLFRFLSSAWRSARTRLESLVVAPRLDPAGAVNAVDALIAVARARDRLRDQESRLHEAFAGQWPTDPRPALVWRQGVGAAPEGVWAGSWCDGLRRSGPAAAAAGAQAAAALAALADLLQGELPAEPWAATLDRLRAMAAHPERWPDQAAVVDAQAALAAAGAGRAAAAAPGWAGVAGLATGLERARAEAVLDAAGARPALARLDPDALADRRRRYADLDRAWLERNRRLAAAAHHARLPRAGDADPGAAVLRREAEKKARHLPLRELVHRAGAALLRTKPVLLMSPAAVAAHLPPGALATDLVIFDEASQVRPVEALGALLRGRQAVVVGDSRQMPPTAFFRRIDGDTESDEDDAPVADVESILGLFLAQGAPARMLAWHYRSRHPDLIAVSNARCYEGRLRTFPSPRRDDGLGLALVPVAGVYERAGSRSNPTEAAAVAEAARAHARATPGESLGIVAFSVAQAQAIESAVDRLREQDPAFNAFWESHPHEPAFVKNLESVQGDERDAMLISVGYGRDADGRLALQFGPLSADGGERRLNVLITRARRRQRVFTGLRPEDLAGATAPGVQMLREFLAACRDGVPATAWTPAAERGLVRRLATAAAGHPLADVPGLGWAADGLGLFDPARLGPDAQLRDRERLAPEVLEGLGWRLLRLHPVAWWRRPEREAERLAGALAKG
jgi:hypothetical protein